MKNRRVLMDRDEMIKKLKKKLNEKRFIHSIGVEYTAANLAFRYGADVEKARIAGLLHDCAKCIPTEEKLNKCKKFGLPINSSEKENPADHQRHLELVPTGGYYYPQCDRHAQGTGRCAQERDAGCPGRSQRGCKTLCSAIPDRRRAWRFPSGSRQRRAS